MQAQPTVGSVQGTWRSRGFRITETAFATPARASWHSHDTACLTVVLEGTYVEDAAGLDSEQERGTLRYKPPCEPHRNSYCEPTRTLLVEFDQAACEAEELRAPFLSEAFALRSAEVARIGQRLHASLASGVTSDACLESDVFELLWLSGVALRRTSSRVHGRVAATAREWLHAHFRESLDLKTVAAEIDVSACHLARAFQRSFGCTMGFYQRRLRVGWAFDQLRNGALSLSRIAHEAGFCDQSHMNRVFRRHTGLTPGGVRGTRRGPDAGLRA